ncbi:hypothetical protein ACFVWN_29010, partial [Nocardiopsis flavescens]
MSVIHSLWTPGADPDRRTRVRRAAVHSLWTVAPTPPPPPPRGRRPRRRPRPGPWVSAGAVVPAPAVPRCSVPSGPLVVSEGPR